VENRHDAYRRSNIVPTRHGWHKPSLGVSHAVSYIRQATGHWRLGHKDLARRWYDKAVAWMDKNKGGAESLRQHRRQARKVLGIDEKP